MSGRVPEGLCACKKRSLLKNMKIPPNVLDSLCKRLKVCAGLVVAGISFLPAASWAAGTPTTGTMYYTTFSGGEDVHDVSYNFDGTSLTLSGNTGIAATPGADGLVFTSDGFLAVGGQANAVYRVNPTTGAFTTQSAGGGVAYHMMADPNGVIYSAGTGEGGYAGPANFSSYNSTLTVNGTPHTVSGAVSVVDTLAWTGSDPTKAFYTSSGPGGTGSFGTIDLTTGITTSLRTGLPAAHGMTYDPFSGMLILMGANHITEIDPTTDTIVADLTLSGTYDQGTVDGKGHIFAANNDGTLTFIDYSDSPTKSIADPTHDFISTQFLAGSLDDVAPLSGSGSKPVPDILGSWTAALCLAGLLGLHAWKRPQLCALARR